MIYNPKKLQICPAHLKWLCMTVPTELAL